jgi:hypothetical protein
MKYSQFINIRLIKAGVFVIIAFLKLLRFFGVKNVSKRLESFINWYIKTLVRLS